MVSVGMEWSYLASDGTGGSNDGGFTPDIRMLIRDDRAFVAAL